MSLPKSRSSLPVFDVFVCRGRMCSSKGSDLLYVALGRVQEERPEARLRLRRGGCYGLCDLSPNVVVRRYDDETARPDADDDLLSLTEADNETAYCTITLEDVHALVRSHLEDDTPYAPAGRDVREAEHPPKNEVEARLRRLRQRRRARCKAG